MNLKSLFKNFNSKKVLILGDVMIDRYMWGKIDRISPEADVPIVNINANENRLGGAANVALNIKELGGIPLLFSVIGTCNQSILFKELMKKENLDVKGIFIEKGRKTTIKTRIIASNKHQLRIDEEDISSIIIEDDIMCSIESIITEIDIIILQDYNKGVLTKTIINKIIKLANKHNIKTIVDPKKKNFDAYTNCSIFKPNFQELQEGTKTNLDVNNIDKLSQVVEKLRKQLNSDAILLTLSENGIYINTENTSEHTPAFKRDIIDVSGAGDSVLSVAALSLANNINFSMLSKLSSIAGGLVCEEVGVIPINKKKLFIEAIKILDNE